MKKLLALILSLAMLALCFTGCGANPKQQEAIDAFNKTTGVFDSIANLINENADVIDDEIISVYTEMSALLTEYKNLLEGDAEVSDEKFDEMIAWFESARTILTDSKAEIEAGLAALTGEAEDNVFPAALADVPAYEISDLSLTGWQLAGGMIDGVEMEEEELNAILTACGGSFVFVFLNEGKVQMVNGETAYEGTYELVYENSAVHAVFDGYEYYGVLTDVNGVNVLIIANTDAPGTAFYLSLIEEG